MDKKALVNRYRPLVSLACRFHNFWNSRKIKGAGNRIQAPCALWKRGKIRISGDNNVVRIGDFSVLKGASIYIHGSNNVIEIGSWCHLAGTELFIEDSGNTISIGDHAKLYGKAELAAIEGTSITLGKDCLFSNNIQFRTGDSHSVLDMEGRRVNASGSITVGDHVWFGRDVTLLKGARIGSHCILGARALVTGEFSEDHCSIAGVPAKIIRRGVDWSIRRIPVGDVAADFVAPENPQEEVK